MAYKYYWLRSLFIYTLSDLIVRVSFVGTPDALLYSFGGSPNYSTSITIGLALYTKTTCVKFKVIFFSIIIIIRRREILQNSLCSKIVCQIVWHLKRLFCKRFSKVGFFSKFTFTVFIYPNFHTIIVVVGVVLSMPYISAKERTMTQKYISFTIYYIGSHWDPKFQSKRVFQTKNKNIKK